MTVWTGVGVLVASLVVFLIGGVWYAPAVFGKKWMELNGVSYEQLQKRPMARVFGFSFVLALVMTANLAAFLGPDPPVGFGAAAGAAAGIGWVAAGFGITYLFERRPWQLWLINGGYHAVTLIVAGAVLGLFAMAGYARSRPPAEIRITSYV